MQFLTTIMVAILALTPAIMAAPGAPRPLEKRSCDCAAYDACYPGCAAYENDPYGSNLGEGLCIEMCWTSSGCSSSDPPCS